MPRTRAARATISAPRKPRAPVTTTTAWIARRGGYRRARRRSPRASMPRDELLEDPRDPQQVGGDTGDGSRCDRLVERADQLGEPRIRRRRTHAAADAQRAARRELRALDHRIEDLLERFRPRIAGADHDGSDEVARQRAARADERERRGDRPRAQADRQPSRQSPARSTAWRSAGSRAPRRDRSACRGAEPLQRRDQRSRADAAGCPRVAAPGRRRRGVRPTPRGTEREMAVDLHGRPSSPARASSVSNAGSRSSWCPAQTSRLPRARQVEQRRRVAGRQRERLLDVDVRSALERGACRGRSARRGGVQTCTTSGRASASSAADGPIRRRAASAANSSAAPVSRRTRRPPRWDRELPERVEMVARHLAGADECDAKRHWMR